MPPVKISALPDADPLTGDEELPCVQDAETRRTTILEVHHPTLVQYSGAMLQVANYSVANDTFVAAITFDSANTDTDGYVVGGDLSKLIAPFSGFYLVEGNVGWDGWPNGYRSMSVTRNGGSIASSEQWVPDPNSRNTQLSASNLTIRCVAGDEFALSVRQTAGFSIDLNGLLAVTYLGDRVPPSPPGVLLEDTFTDADATALTAHTMDTGPGWSISGGTWEIQSNECAFSSPATHIAWSDAGASDVTVSVVVSGSSPGHCGPAARVTSLSNCWVYYYGSLYEINAGSYTVRASGGTAVANDTVSLTCAGTSIDVLINGSSVCSYGSATHNQTETSHGMVGDGTAPNCIMDDFLCE